MRTGSLGLSWYVFDAQAVAVRGRPRATRDIDLTVLAGDSPPEVLLGALVERRGR